MLTRRAVLMAGGVGAVGALAGCSNPTVPDSVTDRRIDGDGESPLAASQFYADLSVASGDPPGLTVTVADDLDLNEQLKMPAKCESLVLVYDDRQVASRTPEVGRSTYRFPLAGEGAYRLFGTGDFHRTNGDQMLEYEVETTLAFTLSGDEVTPEGVFYTRQRNT